MQRGELRQQFEHQSHLLQDQLFFAFRFRNGFADALRQLFQRLRNALAVPFFLMQGAVHVTHGVIEQIERGRGVQPLAVRPNAEI